MRRAAGALPWQRRRRGGDHSPGRGEGQALQDATAEPDLLLPRAAEAGVQPGPRLPGLHRVLREGDGLGLGAVLDGLTRGPAEQGEGQALAGRQIAQPMRSGCSDLVRRRPAQGELDRAERRRQGWTVGAPHRRRTPEVAPGTEVALRGETALRDGERAHQRMRRPQSQLVPSLALPDEQRVG